MPSSAFRMVNSEVGLLPPICSLRATGRASHWDLVRAHFGLFRPAAAAAARARWYAAVDAALADARAATAAAAAAAAVAPAASPVLEQEQTAAPQPAMEQLASKTEPAIVIQAVAVARPIGRGSYTLPEEEAQSPAEAAAAEAKAARRRASVLATTSYRRLGSVRHERGDSLDSAALQQLSVY